MSNERLKFLCDENITSRSDFRKWAKLNHPDKVSNTNKHQKFIEISSIVNEMLPNNDSSIECEKDTTPKKESAKVYTNDLPMNLSKATCMRSAENWTKIMKHHRFDKPSFNATKLVKDMKTMSPKMVKLIDTIRDIDASDFNNEGKYFKHFIFSDVKKGGYGAKIISSALVANGFNHCFSKTLNIIQPPTADRNETFGVLSSTAIYDRPFTQKHVKNVLTMYNERPANIHGQNMRFIVLDSGFKEGIDLFDVKYVHIFENQRNNADLVQAIGRATRSCGQKGLNFLPNVGWPLHIYQYYLTYENPTKTVFDDYLQYAGVDLNMLVISENIEKLAIETSVDYDLNMNINKFENIVEKQLFEIEGGGGHSHGAKDHVHGGAKVRFGGAKVRFGGATTKKVGCNETDKCGNRSTKTVPYSINFLKSIYKKKLPKTFNKLLTKDKRLFFCEKLKNDPEFCEAVNNAYFKTSKSTQTTPRQYDIVPVTVNKNNQLVPLGKQNMLDMKEDMKKTEDMTFEEFQRYINRIFKEYKYKPIKVENMCETKGSDDRIVKFTESQNFVTNYFVPKHFAKGLLVWHSVGTGKTCTAISVKSFLYEKMNYSVIWVTRNTLKEDIWKNMYDKICDHVIREKVKNNKDTTNLRKYLSKRFLPPMSYRQFSNMLEGKNDLYNKLVSLNGEEDILKNTLIIIDEAHKLYSKDLVAMEKPNMKVVEQKIEESPTCKVMLMTGTPIADAPMEFIKLMNLLMKKDKFPTKLDQFKEEFMENNDYTAKGKKDFQNRTKGLISYLNRRFDPRQFAQPKFYKMPVTMSIAKKDDTECTKNAESRRDNCLNGVVKPNDDKLAKLKKEIADLKTEIEDIKGDLTLDKLNKNLKDLINLKKLNLKTLKAHYTTENKRFTKGTMEANASMRECKKEFTKENKECANLAKKQEGMYQSSVFKKC
jgi:hypothetical protein